MNPRRNVIRKRRANKRMGKFNMLRGFRAIANYANAAARIAAAIRELEAKRPIANFVPGGWTGPKNTGEEFVIPRH